MMLNIGTATELLDEEIDQDTDFGFSVVFDDGSRFEATFDLDEPGVNHIRCSAFNSDDERADGWVLILPQGVGRPA